MEPETIDVTDEVVTIRRLRAAAALPGLCALCCVILAGFGAQNWPVIAGWVTAMSS